MKTNPRVDAYIERSAEFARPMLRKLREQAHAICPDAEETIKWGVPMLTWRGKNLCGLAAFKAHAAFFVQGDAADEKQEGMGNFGKMRSIADLPTKADISKLLKERMKVIEGGAPKTKKPPKTELEVPADLARALKASKAAEWFFHDFPPSARRDYIEWITEAKTDETRARRLAQAVEWIAEGKRRNWKYVQK
ncbi:MAG TPA: YdeI/OmpD-associated family protein [Hyphomonas sp.]|nr:YdeI/OmpD-associated family protein [Hyphomonas sp.]HRK69018.1 YdeI/OmpD-associated family protein [Hyphomonas sp.]